MVLPNACETVIEVKMNLRSLIHFMNERLCTRAQWEIRQLAREMKRVVEEQYPELAGYLVPKCEAHAPYSFCTEHKSCGRHVTLKEALSLN
jgi:thymidylate synthase (FAD)